MALGGEIPRPDIHVCLVSEEAVPNLTPLLDKNTRPEEVILLYAEDIGQYTNWLEQLIRQVRRGQGIALAVT